MRIFISILLLLPLLAFGKFEVQDSEIFCFKEENFDNYAVLIALKFKNQKAEVIWTDTNSPDLYAKPDVEKIDIRADEISMRLNNLGTEFILNVNRKSLFIHLTQLDERASAPFTNCKKVTNSEDMLFEKKKELINDYTKGNQI